MSIQINTIGAKIGINTTHGSMSMSQPMGEQSITTTKSIMKIKSEKPRVIIDQYQCFAEAGLKNYLDLTKEAARLGMQKALEGIARITQDGNRMAMIQRNMPPAIPELAKKNAWDSQKEFNIGTLPKSRPRIDVVGDLEIVPKIGKMDIEYTPKKTKIDYQRSKVEFYLRQKPSIDIKHIDEKA